MVMLSDLRRQPKVFFRLSLADSSIYVSWRCPEAHPIKFAIIQTTSLVVSTSPWISSAYAGAGLGRRSSIRLMIFRNRSLDTATPASWKVTLRPWLTTFAPILINFSRSFVNDQCPTSSDSADFSFWLQAEVPTTSAPRPVYSQ